MKMFFVAARTPLLLAVLLLVPAAFSQKATPPPQASHPPIPIRFHLDKPGFVTLVIEDEHGQRVRNLISEASFPAGDNVTWWDGLDDLGRDVNSAAHGVYNVPGKFIAPGTYIARGLYHDKIDLKYEFS